MAKKSELTPEIVYSDYLLLGFQSKVALFKLIEADLKSEQEMAKITLDTLNEVVKTA